MYKFKCIYFYSVFFFLVLFFGAVTTSSTDKVDMSLSNNEIVSTSDKRLDAGRNFDFL
nr:MAG TPA: hypothetical protein [Caudoviricetes sp.]